MQRTASTLDRSCPTGLSSCIYLNVLEFILDHTLAYEWMPSMDNTNTTIWPIDGLPINVHSAPTATQLTGGLSHFAIIIDFYNCTNGHLFTINSILVPPLPVVWTLKLLGLGSFATLILESGISDAISSLRGKTLYIC